MGSMEVERWRVG